MAEAFEDRLYALLTDMEADDPTYIERFKAKGDAAVLYADLAVEPEDLDEELVALMREFGVSMPWGEGPFPQNTLFCKDYWALQSVTVGQLKEAIESGGWPEGVWYYHKNTTWDHIRTAIALPFLLAIAIIAAPIGFVIVGVLWLKDLVFRKAA